MEDMVRETTNKALDFYLTICSNAYGVVVDSFTVALEQFEGMEFGAAEESEKKAVQPINDCNFMFTRPPTQTNPLLNRNKIQMMIIQTAPCGLLNS